MTKSLRITGLAMLALAAFASAAIGGITIHRTPKEGEVTKYRMKADLEVMGQPATFTGLIQEKVTKVDTDGTYSIEQTQLEGKVNIGGNDMDIPSSGSASTTVYAANGDTKEIRGESATPEAYRMSALGAFIEPGKEINVGDKWTHDFKADSKTGQVAAKVEYTYLADEKVGDVDCYKIHVVVNETEGATPASSDTNLWVDKANGQMVKMEGKWTNAPFPGAPEPITATVSLTREPAA